MGEEPCGILILKPIGGSSPSDRKRLPPRLAIIDLWSRRIEATRVKYLLLAALERKTAVFSDASVLSFHGLKVIGQFSI